MLQAYQQIHPFHKQKTGIKLEEIFKFQYDEN